MSFSDAALAAVSVRILQSCIAAAVALGQTEGERLAHLLLQLFVDITQRSAERCHALSPLAALVALSVPYGLQKEFARAFDTVCAAAGRNWRGDQGTRILEFTPLFKLLLAYASHLEDVVYGSSAFE